MTARVPTLCAALDDLLGGGVERATITEFFGEGGSGKTNLCLVLARNVARSGKKAVLIDTEGVSMERLFQVCGGLSDKPGAEALMKRIFVFEARDLDEEEEAVNKAIALAEQLEDVDLIVLDSATGHYRRYFGSDEEGRARQRLGLLVTRLLRCARTRAIPVVITNQVYTDIESDSFEPLGGHALGHTSKAIVRLDRLAPNRRRATVEKHRSIAEGSSAEFALTADGIG
ncbi:MAG TPA: DNA repair and recombination protein RadB [Candidatus Thermoplasmatota archaeon]|nr:DNA repair and recombination protein RadB [Candidatus Thermoplasmatota archaeon]